MVIVVVLGTQVESKPFHGVFMVPQKIHMATGTLADQVTYPTRIERSERTAEIESRLQELLDLVGVGYLVTRWAGDATGRNAQPLLRL